MRHALPKDSFIASASFREVVESINLSQSKLVVTPNEMNKRSVLQTSSASYSKRAGDWNLALVVKVLCSPDYQEARKVFCHLSALWMHNANPDIKNKWIEHYSYNITQNRWLTQQAKSIQMVLVQDEAYRQAA